MTQTCISQDFSAFREPMHKLNETLRKLKRESEKWSGSEKRNANRSFDLTFPTACELDLEGHGRQPFISLGRNISATGCGVLLPKFVHPGSSVYVTLETYDGERVASQGVIQWCRHVEGRIHEAGIKFNQKVDPTHFVPNAEQPKSARNASAADNASAHERLATLANELQALAQSNAGYADIRRVIESMRQVVRLLEV